MIRSYIGFVAKGMFPVSSFTRLCVFDTRPSKVRHFNDDVKYILVMCMDSSNDVLLNHMLCCAFDQL